MIQAKEIFKGILSFFRVFLMFFALVAFVVTCTFLLSFKTISLPEEDVRAFAPIAFITVIALALVFEMIDFIRRKVTVDRPVKAIQEGLQRLKNGDFSARISIPADRYSKFAEIAESINLLAEELSGVETLRSDFIASVSHELKSYRLCGLILLTLNIVLAGVVILVITKNQSFEYAGVLIFVMAAYTFYITIAAVVNIVKYRKYDSPVMSAAKVISFAAALVSMLSLETAMLSRFGSEDNSPYFDRIMIGATGAGVCVIIVSVSVYITVRSTGQIKKLKKSNKQGA